MSDPNATKITAADIKKPSRFLMKFLKGITAGMGGVGQRALDKSIAQFIPNSALSSFLQWIGLSAANGFVDNKWIESALNGGVALSATDLVERLYKMYLEKGGNVGLSTTTSKSSLSIPISNSQSDNGLI